MENADGIRAKHRPLNGMEICERPFTCSGNRGSCPQGDCAKGATGGCFTVYVIESAASEKVYIGYTSQKIEARFEQHINNRTGSTPIKRAMDEFGRDTFSIYAVTSVDCLERALEIEAHLIASNSKNPAGWNGRDPGPYGTYNSGWGDRKRASDRSALDASLAAIELEENAKWEQFMSPSQHYEFLKINAQLHQLRIRRAAMGQSAEYSQKYPSRYTQARKEQSQ